MVGPEINSGLCECEGKPEDMQVSVSKPACVECSGREIVPLPPGKQLTGV